MLGIIAGLSGDLEEAENHFTELRQLAIQHQDMRRLRTAVANLGEVARIRKDFAQAKTYIEESLLLVESSGDMAGTLIDLLNLGNVLISLQDQAVAHQKIYRALTEATRIGAVEHQIPATITMARLIAYQNNLERSLELLGLAQSHPATAAQDKQEIERVLVEIREKFDTSGAHIDEKLTAGAKLNFDATIQTLLSNTP